MAKTKLRIEDAPAPKRGEKAPRLTGEEKQDYVEQVEEFEGPNRREKRGSDPEPPKEPGVARS